MLCYREAKLQATAPQATKWNQVIQGFNNVAVPWRFFGLAIFAAWV
ncbi:hypothetical protein [Aphanothece sacrum]|nr:hypothetical protein [Aphanothece sacrum]